MNKNFAKRISGVTLVETIIYSGILVISLVIVVQVAVSIIRVHRVVKLSQTLESSGAIAMERILREVRNASSVALIGSTFGSSPGTLKLDGIDPSGADYTLTFNIDGNTLVMAKDGGATGPLINSTDIKVDSLVFRHLTNSNTEAVRVEISLSGSYGELVRNLDLFGFAVLRGSY